jgi:hypothetical protein
VLLKVASTELDPDDLRNVWGASRPWDTIAPRTEDALGGRNEMRLMDQFYVEGLQPEAAQEYRLRRLWGLTLRDAVISAPLEVVPAAVDQGRV